MAESYHSRSVILALNAIFSPLIPKESNATSLGKFPPIVLCNVIQKLISKLFSNKLKLILSILISLEKICYLEGHKTLDSIILSHETIHSLKVLKKTSMFLKLEFAKTFDRLG